MFVLAALLVLRRGEEDEGVAARLVRVPADLPHPELLDIEIEGLVDIGDADHGVQVAHAELHLWGTVFGRDNMVREAEGNDEIQALGGSFARSERIVALTGAGISTESGIPGFPQPRRPLDPRDQTDHLPGFRRFGGGAAGRLAPPFPHERGFFAAAQPNAGHLGSGKALRRRTPARAHHAEHRPAASAERNSGRRPADRDPWQLGRGALPRLPRDRWRSTPSAP